ncbi:MAG: adenylate kinase family protein [Candidatus Bathyarchaeia archaeon]
MLKVIFVTGSPGVGKTTLATRLAAAIHSRHINLGSLALKRGFTLGYDAVKRCSIIDLAKVGAYLSKVVGEGCAGSYLVVEGHSLVKLPNQLVEWIFLLRCHPLELRRRLERKGYRTQKVLENLWAEILDYSLIEALDLYGPSRVHEVDTTDKGVDETVKEALAVLRGELKPSFGRFDWLSVLAKGGELEKLMAEERGLQ